MLYLPAMSNIIAHSGLNILFWGSLTMPPPRLLLLLSALIHIDGMRETQQIQCFQHRHCNRAASMPSAAGVNVILTTPQNSLQNTMQSNFAWI